MWLAIALAVIWGGIFVAGSYRCSVRHRRRRGGAPPWSHQYDARGLGQDIAEAHAASRAAAIHRHRRYHVHGLDHGEIAERENAAVVVLDKVYTRTGGDGTPGLGTGIQRDLPQKCQSH